MASAPVPQTEALRAVLAGDDLAVLRLVDVLPDGERVALLKDAAALCWVADPSKRCPRCLLVVQTTVGQPFPYLHGADGSHRLCHPPCFEAINKEIGQYPATADEVIPTPAPAIVAARQMIPLVLGAGSQQADALLALMRRDELTMLCLIHDLSIEDQGDLSDAAAKLAELAGGLHVCGPCGRPTWGESDTTLHQPLDGTFAARVRRRSQSWHRHCAREYERLQA